MRIVDCDDGKFMNHSEQPNTDFRVFDQGFALTDIAVGEEITCNYYEFDPGFRGFGPSERAGFGDRGDAGGRVFVCRADAGLNLFGSLSWASVAASCWGAEAARIAKPCRID